MDASDAAESTGSTNRKNRMEIYPQAEGIKGAGEVVHHSGGGAVVIHCRDGRIRDSDALAPGNDPTPPRDRT